MPTYDYRCSANGKVYEVRHRMADSLTTWKQLAEIGGFTDENIAADAAVERVLTTGGVVSSRVLKNPEPACASGGCCGGGNCAI